MQEMMNMPCDPAGRVAVSHAICKDDSCNIVAARKNRTKIAAPCSPGRYGNYVSLQPRKFQGAVSSLISRPKLHASKGAFTRRRAFKCSRLDPLDSHDFFDVCERSPGTCFFWLSSLPPCFRGASYYCQIHRIYVA